MIVTCQTCGKRYADRFTACPFCAKASAGGTVPGAAGATAPGAAGGTLAEIRRYPTEQPLFVIGVLFSSLVWLAMVVSIVGIFYGLAGLLFTLIAHALFLAHVRCNAVRVSPQQFPDLYERCRQAAERLGLPETPEVYLMQAGGALNAFATKLLARKFVVIFSDLADQCQDPRQLDFVVGHEIGHLAAGHLRWNAFLWPYMLLPWLGAAYLRAREYSADAYGYAVVGEAEAAMRGLMVLAAGGKHGAQADLVAFIEQCREAGQFWPSVLELVSSHPFLCKRVAALQERHQPGSVTPIRRNPLAYPLAPFLGLAAAGPASGGAGLLVVVAVIGIIAAIAIPSLLRARISANEAAAIGDMRAVLEAERLYASVSRTYGSLDCLVQPSRCLPGYNGPALLDAAAAAREKSGYARELSLAPDGSSFAFLAVPLSLGQTGVRSFCGDARGLICYRQDGRPQVSEGLCGDCLPMQ